MPAAVETMTSSRGKRPLEDVPDAQQARPSSVVGHRDKRIRHRTGSTEVRDKCGTRRVASGPSPLCTDL
jgi:hypothetical protein